LRPGGVGTGSPPGGGEELEDDLGEKRVSGATKKQKKVIESEGEEEDGSGGGGDEAAAKGDKKGGGVGAATEDAPKVESPEIPVKEGLKFPIRLEIPEAPVESGGEEKGVGLEAGEAKERKRRRVELSDDEVSGGDEEKGAIGEDGEGEKIALDGKETEPECAKGAGGEGNVEGGGLEIDRSELKERGGSENVDNVLSGEQATEVLEDQPMEEETGGLGHRQARRRSSLDHPPVGSLLERMIDHRNEALGLVEKEEESGEEEGQGDDDIDAFIVPEEGGDRKGYGGADEEEAGPSEAGQSEGEMTRKDESVIRKTDFVMYLDYMLQTLQDPDVRAAATEEGELRDAVKHCEVRWEG
jgi:hypothetical protein